MIVFFGGILITSLFVAYRYKLFSDSKIKMEIPNLISIGLAVFLFYNIPLFIFSLYYLKKGEVDTSFIIILQLLSEWIKSIALVALSWVFLKRSILVKNIKKECLTGVIGWVLCVPFVHLTAFLIKEGRQFIGIPYVPSEIQNAVSVILQFMQDPLYFLMLLLIICVGAPLTEEILFRGFIQGGMRRWFGSGTALFLSSLIFSILHYDFRQGGANFELLGGLFVLSMVLGYVYEKRKNLWAPVALHMTHNSVTALILWLKNA